MNRVTVTLLCALSLCSIVLGADAKLSPEEQKDRQEMMLKKTGGFINVSAMGPAVVVIDSRERAGGASKQFESVFANIARINVSSKEVKRDGAMSLFAQAKALRKSEDALILLMIANDGVLSPALSVYPEERLAIINADCLKGGNDPMAPEVRVVKELWRGLGFAGGVGYGQMKNDVMQPAFSTDDLDALTLQYIQPMNFAKMAMVFNEFGVKRSRRVPYRLAVKEGWAPAPTNEVQRAVWDSVKNPAITNTPAK